MLLQKLHNLSGCLIMHPLLWRISSGGSESCVELRNGVITHGGWIRHDVQPDQPIRGRYQIHHLGCSNYNTVRQKNKSATCLREAACSLVSRRSVCLLLESRQAHPHAVLHNISKYAKHPLMQLFLPLITILSKWVDTQFLLRSPESRKEPQHSFK